MSTCLERFNVRAFAIKDDKTYIKSHTYIENFEKWLANHFFFCEEGAPCIDNGCTGDSFISLKDFFYLSFK